MTKEKRGQIVFVCLIYSPFAAALLGLRGVGLWLSYALIGWWLVSLVWASVTDIRSGSKNEPMGFENESGDCGDSGDCGGDGGGCGG